MLTLPIPQTLNTQIAVAAVVGGRDEGIHTDWRTALPTLSADGVTVRPLCVTDAPSLFAMLTAEEVARFITPPPTTVEGFERFITWTHRQQAAGRYICFGIVPAGHTHAVGLIQVRALDASFTLAEWVFALGSRFWGTGIFESAAREVLRFAFDELPVNRIEARAAVANGRGNGALQKIGATCEAVLRRSFRRNGTYMDQRLWAMTREEWRLIG